MSILTETKAQNVIRDFSEVNLDELIGALLYADDEYHNTGNPIVEDDEYDIAKRAAYAQNPAHVFFTGVGSTVRGGKIKLPYQMGSLDQVEVGEIEDWVQKNGLSQDDIVITDKLDGTSAMIIYDSSGDLQIAYSRGNGVEGADITRHIREIGSVPKKVNGPLVVRSEVIIQKAKFDDLKQVQKRSSGDDYKNPRNAVAGIMNSKTNKTAAYKYIDVVTYEVVGSELDKHVQLDELENLGFIVARRSAQFGNSLTDAKLSKLLNDRRDSSLYEIDGFVLDVNSKATRARMNPTKSTLNPAYAVKYKVASADNDKNVRVIEVEWNVSKHGYLKPRVRIEPTDLMGVTIQHATGFNAKFIKEGSIGKGAIIRITRSGDVIPFILEVIEPGKLDLPDGDWNDTGVDLIATDSAATDMVHFKQTADFFASIEAPFLKDGSVQKLFDKGFNTIEAIIEAEELDFIVALGKNGTKTHEGLHSRLSDIYVHDFIGSTPFFGRGVGKRKFKKLFEAIGHDDLVANAEGPAATRMVGKIASVEGFDTKTAMKIVSGLSQYSMFLDTVDNYVSFTIPKTTGITMNGQKVVFTGFRDKALQAEVEANGGSMQSTVSGKTTILVAANPSSTSGKMNKARANGTLIVGIDDFKQML